ncbi:aspartate kinase [Anaeromicrobium sediminis]|uniref:Aspartokinase n=1 Tax=Anaeromicrobium sediminis TaxID=1478221 RepID=A0A267MDH8_9FIRM|nr:aspartate kinase [Anaeromicrobium sediminis]PAB57654.1 aspartate kinase [Anaeromicrobium sediminis]
MAVVVQKYGGSSVATLEKIKAVASKISKRREKGDKVVVVVSAMGDTTDSLINMANSLNTNPDKRELDMLISTGEQVSISLMSMALQNEGCESVSLTGMQAGIQTKGFHSKARIEDIDLTNLKNHLSEDKVVVVAGFQGVNNNGDITTLGRGGSDTTAVALAAKLDCDCEIYTDVDGIYTVDPRLFPTARKLKSICYEEMLEMASLGAGVMETRSVEIAQKYGVKVYVALNTGEWEGTYIKESDNTMESKAITGLSLSDKDLMVTIDNVRYDIQNISYIFNELASKDINIDMISQTAPAGGHVSLSFTAPKTDEKIILDILENVEKKIGNINVEIEKDITKLSVVGIGMRSQSGVAAKVFDILARNNIQFKQVTTSEIRISYTIDTKDRQRALEAVANEFNL